MNPRYRRILIKMSGEALLGENAYGTDNNIISFIAEEVKQIHSLGVQCAIVIGGGNIYRGAELASKVIDRATADYIGMIATVMNAIILHRAFENSGIATSIQSAIEVKPIAKLFRESNAIEELKENKVLILGGGSGNPFFTTDTAGVLRALELKADILIKATKVDGIYSEDPLINKEAHKYDKISYSRFIKENLRVMDATAITLCKEHKLPILVLDLLKKGNILNAVMGENIGSLVSD